MIAFIAPGGAYGRRHQELLEEHQRFRRFPAHYERERDALRTGVDPNYGLPNHLAEYFSLFPDELHHKKEDIIYNYIITNDEEHASSPFQGMHVSIVCKATIQKSH